MSTTPSSAPHHTTTTPTAQRALVLGGGGSTGNAWLIGVIAGLYDAGLDVTPADLTVGTSAGSTAAAQLAGATPTDLYNAILAAVPAHENRQLGPEQAREIPKPAVDHLTRIQQIIAASDDVGDLRRRLGAAALDLDAASDGSWSTQWRTTVAARLPGQDWPQRNILITAIDAQTGEPVVFDRHSGVDLVDAVAASCASGLPYRIGDRRYLDGGYRANAENADLATGSERVLALSPFRGRSLHPLAWGTHLATQVAALRGGGSLVQTIFPDRDYDHLFGGHAMNLTLRPHAARIGYAQGRALTEAVSAFWLR